MPDLIRPISSIGFLMVIGVFLLSCAKPSPPSSIPNHPLLSNTPGASSSSILSGRGFEHDHNQRAGIAKIIVWDVDSLEPGEVCVINENETDLQALDIVARDRGYTKKKRRMLEGLRFVMTILHVPPGQTVNEGILELRQIFPSQIIDANHRYILQEPQGKADQHRYGQQLVSWSEQAVSCGTPDLRIGMVDTAVNVSHPFLQDRSIRIESFLADGTPSAPHEHGTAIATLLMGHTPSMEAGLLPKGRLLVAEAFRQLEPGRIEATTWNVVRALDWLVKEKVNVINLSLGGPQNALLAFAVQQTMSQDIPIVAAAGNSGPQGKAMFPAAQEGVLAVTAVDATLHPYRLASRGSYITFSAPGVDIWVPNETGNGVFKSGTSFATPFVTTAVATIKQSHPEWKTDQIARQLATHALDLGVKGKDETFGWGLIQILNICRESPTIIHSQPSTGSNKY